MATSYPEDKPTLALDKVDSPIDEKLDASSDLSGDTIIPGSEGVTEHEYATLRRLPDRLPYTAWLVVIVEFAERWSYYGTANAFNNYIRAPLPVGSTTGAVPSWNRAEGVAGALGQGVQKSFALRTFNSFWVYVTPWLGGIVADTWLGRYTTIIIFSFVCIIGHVILTASAAPADLQHPQTALGLLALSIVIMGLGAGSIKANVSPMVAEQYQGKLRKETLPSGEVILRDPTVTIQSVYLWFYAAINWGSCGAISAAFIARDHGYWQTFLVPTCIFALVPGVLLIGRKNYIKTPPRGSILLETLRVCRIALRAHFSWNPVRFVKNIRTPDFWEAAKPCNYPGGELPPSITWDDEFVDEVSRTVKACKVFLFFPFYWLCYSQIDGNLGTMAASMKLNGTPNDLIQNLNPITLVIIIPIFDFVIYPTLRRWGINFSPIKRIYAGFLVAGLAMLYAAVLQHFLYAGSPCHDNQPSACLDEDNSPRFVDINVWVVSGPYILVAISEVFASITSLEYAFTKAPKRMKSVVMAFSQFQTALASALNFALTAVNVEQKFTWLFGSFGITSALIGTVFFFTFRKLDKMESELNRIGQGKREGFADERPKGTEEKA